MMGILPFLIQWVALGMFGSKNLLPSSLYGPSATSYSNTPNYYPNTASQTMMPPKSHWTLLTEFQQLPEEEIESFLPQICNMILDRDSLNDPAIFDYFERIILTKCAQCLPFGLRVCGVLRGAAAAPSEGLLKNILLASSATTQQHQRKQECLRSFQEKVEYYTSQGSASLPAMVRDLRIEYFQDFQFLLDTLARLSIELKSYPVGQRNLHLKRALSQCNALLYYRMLSQRCISNLQTSFEDIYAYHQNLDIHQIAALCPAAACFSLHFPLQHSQEKTLRILRFVESECETLPSKDRCPYLVVVELLEQPFLCKSDELFTEGRELYLASNEEGKYVNPQVMPTMHAPPRALPHALSEHHHQNQHQQQHQTRPTNHNSNNDIRSSNNEEIELQDNGVVPSSNTTSATSTNDSHKENSRYNHQTKHHNSHNDNNDNRNEAKIIRHPADDNHPSENDRDVHLFARPFQYSNHHHQQYYHYNTDNNIDIADYAMSHNSNSNSNSVVNSNSLKGWLAQDGLRGGAGGPQQTPSSAVSSEEESIQAWHQRYAHLQPHKRMHTDAMNSENQANHNSNSNTNSNTNKGQTENDQQPPVVFRQHHRRSVIAPTNSNSHSNSNSNTYSRGVKAVRPSVTTTISPPILHPHAAIPAQGTSHAYNHPNDDNDINLILTHGNIRSNNNINNNIHRDSYEQYRSQHNHPFIKPHHHHYHNHPPSPHMLDEHRHPAFHHKGHYHNTEYADMNSNQEEHSDMDNPSISSVHSNNGNNNNVPATRQGIVRPKTWEEKKSMVQSLSPFGHLSGWTLRSFIVKAGDDLRKEVLAMQMISQCQRIFQLENIDIYLRPYQILNTGHMSGLVEFVEGAMSIDRIKKLKPDKSMSLSEYFSLHFGDSYSFLYAKAIHNFVRSLAGYSLFTYVAQLRDRHNANLLVDSEGHLIHIDFGFVFGDSPGFNMNFESAPFKFTKEYLDLIGGLNSQMFALFEDLFVRGFLALQKHVEGLSAIVSLYYGDKRRQAAEGVRTRLLYPQTREDILALIRDSYDNWRTKQYDWFQQQSNNIQM